MQSQSSFSNSESRINSSSKEGEAGAGHSGLNLLLPFNAPSCLAVKPAYASAFLLEDLQNYLNF